jgi:hypothetical protein
MFAWFRKDRGSSAWLNGHGCAADCLRKAALLVRARIDDNRSHANPARMQKRLTVAEQVQRNECEKQGECRNDQCDDEQFAECAHGNARWGLTRYKISDRETRATLDARKALMANTRSTHIQLSRGSLHRLIRRGETT